MRFVCIDLGDQRTGIAVGDAVTRLASPVDVLQIPIDRAGGEDLLKAIARHVHELLGPAPRVGSAGVTTEPAEPLNPLPEGGSRGGGWVDRSGASDARGTPRPGLIVGLPLNMDGTEGPRAKATRAWAKRIQERTGWPVHFVDERLSSVRADAKLARSGLTHKQKKERRDAIAAAAILQGFLDSLSPPTLSPDVTDPE